MKCEYNWWQRTLRFMVRDRKLTPIERMSSRVGYMGVAFLISGQMDSRTNFIYNWFLLRIISSYSTQTMEFSFITIKWSCSLDYAFYK